MGMDILNIVFIAVGIAGAVWSFIGIIKGVRKGEVGLDILAVVAIVSTLLVGEYLASAVVVVMVLTGDFLEDYATKQAEKELSALISNSPETAIREDGSQIPASDVKVGDILLVQPGGVVAVDGVAIENCTLNEASLTGESLPVNKVIGDQVLSGSVSEGLFKMKVTHLATDSAYQRITQLVELAKDQKPSTVKMADQVSIPFTIVSLLIAAIAWAITGEPLRFAEVLVLATPCPLLIAAPVAFLAGLSKAASKGVIIKGGTVIEVLSRTKILAFDKTGTLTQGRPSYERIELTVSATIDEVQALRYAASLEKLSPHVLAQAIVNENREPLFEVQDLKEITGVGVEANVNGIRVQVGKPTHNVPLQGGETVVELVVGGVDTAHIFLRDQIRPEVPDTIKKLRKLGVRRLIMLTGDKQETARFIADQAGLDVSDVRSSLLPHQKFEAVAGLKSVCSLNKDCKQVNQSPKTAIGMVGDGVNDAPVLAASDVGIAFGGDGSSAATQSADVVLQKNDFELVYESLAISRNTMSIAKQSMIGGITLSVVLMLVAAFGFIPAVIGAILQEVIDVFAIVNGIRARL